MDSIEAAVAENNHNIAGFDQRFQAFDNRIRHGLVEGRPARGGNIRDHALGIQSFVFGQLIEAGNLRNKNAICFSEGLWQVVLKDRTAGCVRARLEKGSEARAAKFFAKAGKGLADCGGVMSKIVDYCDPVDLAPHLLAAADALE